MKEIHVPDLGDFKDVVIVDVLVKPGDRVEVESGLITLETDKATMDVPSPLAGVIVKMHVAKGDRVSSGTLLATLEGDEATATPAPGAKAADAKPSSSPANSAPANTAPANSAPANTAPANTAVAPKPASTVAAAGAEVESEAGGIAAPPADAALVATLPVPSGVSTNDASKPVAAPGPEASFSSAHAGPSVRALARELGVDLAHVSGSGRKGRISADDVKAWVKSVMTGKADGPAKSGGAALPAVPVVDFAKFGAVELVPLTRIQRIAGPRLHASWVNLPHVTQMDEADITELEEARRWLKLKAATGGIQLTSLAFVLRACVLALQKFPRFGASLDASGQNLVMKKYCHLGFAADTPGGLVVPVIRDADRKDVFELAQALGELSLKAREGRLAAAEMQGGCFTVSNLGGIGGTAFTPIINAPEVAVLGVSRAAQKPLWQGGAFVPRLMLPLSLSYDHRVIDGADGARFTGFLVQALADVPGLLAARP